MRTKKHKDFFETKVYMNTDNTRYCIVRLYRKKRIMQEAYREFRSNDSNHFRVLGVHCAYDLVQVKGNKRLPETGTIFLSIENCGAGVATHEILHGVLWASKKKLNDPQYPIVIKNMRQEEKILHNFSHAVIQFYNWFWKIEKEIKSLNAKQ